MRLETFYAEVEQFLGHDKQKVMVVSGGWGVGKTHGWKVSLERFTPQQNYPIKYYAYISLFGLENVSALKTAAWINRVDFAKRTHPVSSETVSQALNSLKDVGLKTIGSLNFKNSGIGVSLNGLTEGLADGFVRDTLVCFDDLERAGERLSMSEILGYVSYLKERKECKIVILLNESELKGQEDRQDRFGTYRAHLEKVADVCLLFSPTSQDATEIGISTRHEHFEFVRNSCISLDITNIRTINRIDMICDRLVVELSKYEKRVIEHSIRFAVLFLYCKYQPNVAPDLGFILQYNKYTYELNLGNAFDNSSIIVSDKDAKNEEFRLTLQNYEYVGMTSFGKVIFDFINTGHLDQDWLFREAANLEAELKKGDRATEFRDAMKLVTSSFAPNDDQVLNGLAGAIRDNPSLISTDMLAEAVAIIRAIQPNYDMEGLIADYVDRSDADRNHWDISSEFNRGALSDPDIMAAFNRKFESFPDDRNLMDILVALGKGSGWSVEDIQYLSKRSPDDYYQLFSSLEGNELKLAVRGAFKFSDTYSNSNFETKVWQDATEAFRRLAERSPLNQIRAKKLGVKLYPPTAPPP
ncbi:MAG: hypothetical protein H9535_14740 [Ignavibacteria bacterium]|nr:hypothetical protein [Ignavibacteria bacterium]